MQTRVFEIYFKPKAENKQGLKLDYQQNNALIY